MPTGHQGSIRLFRLAGVDVFLHWSWFVVALFEINSRVGKYSSVLWNVFEYLALFLIVLTHEFGHAMACRKVGGVADRIVLWPLGGVAYIDAPQRPGAMLWSIAAGPLVNLALLPVFFAAVTISVASHWALSRPNLYHFLLAVFAIDLVLLIFNMLPVYPLDGGQILRSVLWYFLGRARSLMVATMIGFVGVAVMAIYAIRSGSTWYFVLAVFIVLNCWGAFKHSIALWRLSKLPRRPGFACPWCTAAPLLGAFWVCGACQAPFDVFATQGVCPGCNAKDAFVHCCDCDKPHTLGEWTTTLPVAQHS
jgi:Zn-dependent protease